MSKPESVHFVRAAAFGLLFLLLWLACRSFPSVPHIFPEGGEPRLAGSDPYFHLRHSQAVLNNYPSVQRKDRFSHFPSTETGLNQGLFDQGVATLAKLSGGTLSPRTILIWISPLASALAILLLYATVYRRAGPECSIVFLLLALAYPASLISNAALGYGDHHATELLLATITGVALFGMLQHATRVLWAPAAALPLYLFFQMWAGAPMHLFLVGLVFFAAAFSTPQDQLKVLASKGTLYGLTLLLLTETTRALAPEAVIWWASASAFRLGCGMLALGYGPLCWLCRKLRPKPKLALGLLLGLGPLVGALMVPDLRHGLGYAFGVRTDLISEHTAVSLKLLWAWGGVLWLAVPGVVVLAVKRRKARPYLVPLVYGGGLLLFWFVTRDFAYYTPPLVALSAAVVLCHGRPAPVNPLLIGALLLLPPVPFTGVVQPWYGKEDARLSVLYTDGLAEASEWLKEVSPGLDSPRYGLLAPWDLGNILAHTTQTPVGFSQTSSSRLAKLLFSDQPEEVYQKLTEDDRPFRFILLPARNLSQKFGGEMLVAGLGNAVMYQAGRTISHGEKSFQMMEPTSRNLASLLVRLFRSFDQGMGRYRMVFESKSRVVQAARVSPSIDSIIFQALPVTDKELEALQPHLNVRSNTLLKTREGLLVDLTEASEVRVFELVPGALVRGTTTPETFVQVELDLAAPSSGREWTTRWGVWSDADGRYELRVPYPTQVPDGMPSSTVRARGLYRLTTRTDKHEFAVKESQVQSESQLEFP